MKILPLELENGVALYRALDVLNDGGIVAHPTETCYGFACDLTNLQAVQKLFALKQRSDRQPVSALFASVDAAKEYVEWNDAAEAIASAHLPGPLTLILALRPDAPRTLYATPHGTKTIGVRISSHPLTALLADAFPAPLSTTSANVHHEPEMYDGKQVRARFSTLSIQPDIVLDGGRIPAAKPSTIVDCSSGTPRMVRQGDIQI